MVRIWVKEMHCPNECPHSIEVQECTCVYVVCGGAFCF